MKNSSSIFVLTCLLLFLVGCKSNQPAGIKVNEPFSGSKYESDNKFFRGTGKGVSVNDNIARGKADLEAKNQLAAQVNTTIKNVSDQYLGQTENANSADVADKFQSLSRQVMNTTIADLRKIGEEKYFDASSGNYSVYVAYEIKKNSMWKLMKKQAKTLEKVDERTMQDMDRILDEQIKASEE